MSIIFCQTCGKRWPHGEYPDVGGAAAHDHQQQTGHAVVVGEAEALTPATKRQPRRWWQKMLGFQENGAY